MIVCGIDLETTGLSPIEDRVTELGFVLWDTTVKTPLLVVNTFVDPGRSIPPEISAINKITTEMVSRWGIPSKTALNTLVSNMDKADVVCAHNGTNFDKPFIEEWGRREGVQIPDKLWIDTRTDLPVTGTRLIYMCAEHAGFVNPFPHRAVFDVMSMLRLLSQFDVEAVVARAKLPTITLQAQVRFDEKEKAKEQGYQWREANTFSGKAWLKDVKEGEEKEAIAAAAKAGFKATVYCRKRHD